MSSADGVTAVPSDIVSGASQISFSAEQLRAVHTALYDALAAEGACWGGDEVGQSFAKQYVPQAMNALDSCTQFDGGVQSLADVSTTWGKGYQELMDNV